MYVWIICWFQLLSFAVCAFLQDLFRVWVISFQGSQGTRWLTWDDGAHCLHGVSSHRAGQRPLGECSGVTQETQLPSWCPHLLTQWDRREPDHINVAIPTQPSLWTEWRGTWSVATYIYMYVYMYKYMFVLLLWLCRLLSHQRSKVNVSYVRSRRRLLLRLKNVIVVWRSFPSTLTSHSCNNTAKKSLCKYTHAYYIYMYMYMYTEVCSVCNG